MNQLARDANVGTSAIASPTADGWEPAFHYQRLTSIGRAVEEFGAVGDGVTDDGAALQAAIDAAVTGGFRLLLYSASGYLTKRELTISGNSVCLEGRVSGTTIKGGGGDYFCVLRDETGHSRCLLRNLKIDANASGRTGQTQVWDALRLVNMTDLALENVEVTGSRGYGASHAVGMQVGATRAQLTNVRAVDCGTRALPSDGIYLFGSQIAVQGATAERCYDHGLVYERGSVCTANGVRVVDCAGGIAVSQYGTSNATNNDGSDVVTTNFVVTQNVGSAAPGAVAVATASNTTPVVITTSTAHGLSAGDHVIISGVTGNSAANGSFVVKSSPAPTSTTFAIQTIPGVDVVGTGAGTGGYAQPGYCANGIDFGTYGTTGEQCRNERVVFADGVIENTANIGYPAVIAYADATDLAVGQLISAKAITGATNATPISITATAHGFSTGDVVEQYGVIGNEAANGRFKITVTDADHYTLADTNGNAVAGTGAYTSGGFAQKSGRTRDVRLQNLTIRTQNPSSYGVYLNNLDGFELSGCRIESDAPAIQVDKRCVNGRIHDNHIQVGASAAKAVQVQGGCHRVEVSRNNILGRDGVTTHGVYFFDDGAVGSTQCVAMWNKCRGSSLATVSGIGNDASSVPTVIGGANSITGALSTVTDAAAKAVLTSIIGALTAQQLGTNNTT